MTDSEKLDKLLELTTQTLPRQWSRLLPEEGFAWMSPPLPQNDETRFRMSQPILRVLVYQDLFTIQFMDSAGNIYGSRELRRAE